jgi:hypothetical protein
MIKAKIRTKSTIRRQETAVNPHPKAEGKVSSIKKKEERDPPPACIYRNNESAKIEEL